MQTLALILSAATATFLAAKNKFPEATLFFLIFILLSNPVEHCEHAPEGSAAKPVLVDYSEVASGDVLPMGSEQTADTKAPVMTDEDEEQIAVTEQQISPPSEIPEEDTGLQLLQKGMYDRQFTGTPLQQIRPSVSANLETAYSDEYTSHKGMDKNSFFTELLKDGPLESRAAPGQQNLQFLYADARYAD